MLETGPRLQKLYVRRAMQIPLDCFRLVTSCSSLSKLTLANVPHLDDETTSFILSTLGNQLFFLQLENLMIGNSTFQVVTNCKNLKQLRIFTCENWTNLDIILESSMHCLRTLIIHGCLELEGRVDCQCPFLIDVKSPDSANLPEIQKIRDMSYLPLSATAHLTSPTTPGTPSVYNNENNTTCRLKINLKHLEIAGCHQLADACLKSLLNHSISLKRFIFVGSNLSSSIRKLLLKRPQTISSIYVLTPSTPGFQTN
jgi:hypothetical protein